jgi:WD40 repeat protein
MNFMRVLLATLAGLSLFADVTNNRSTLDPRTLKQVREFQVDFNIQATQAHIGEDGTCVAGYTANGVAIYNAVTGTKISEIDTGGEHPHDGAMSPDGRYYALSFDSQDVTVYDFHTGKKIDTFQVDGAYS